MGKSSNGDYEVEDETLATTWTHSIVRVAGNRWIQVASCRSLSVRRGRSSFSSIRLSNDDNDYCTFIPNLCMELSTCLVRISKYFRVIIFLLLGIILTLQSALYKRVTQKKIPSSYS